MTRPSPATNPASSPATYQDVLGAPPNMVAQVVDGVLYTFPRPSAAHALAGSRLCGIVQPPFDFGRGGPGGWWVLFEPELHFSEDIVVPDMAGWRRSRMPQVPDVAYFTLAPDWVCEVLSPSTRSLDLGGKRGIYEREKVCHFWLIDPNSRSLEALELRSSKWHSVRKLSGDVPVCAPPFESITFNLGDLWLADNSQIVHRAPLDAKREAQPIDAS